MLSYIITLISYNYFRILNLSVLMMHNCFLLILLSSCLSLSECQKKMQIHLLGNGGTIINSISDDISLTIKSNSLLSRVFCPNNKRYVSDAFRFKSNQINRFGDLWVAIKQWGDLQLKIQQKNSHQFVLVQGSIDLSNVGFYEVAISKKNFRFYQTVNLSFIGNTQIYLSQYQRTSDYYLLLQLHNQDTNYDSYSLDSNFCYLKSNPLRSVAKLIVVFLAMMILN